METMFARKGLRRDAVESHLKRLVHAKSVLGVEDALSVLLIGITGRTRAPQQDLSALENEGVLIRYLELDEGAQPRAEANGVDVDAQPSPSARHLSGGDSDGRQDDPRERPPRGIPGT